eukprot:TRINITY_DN17789_c0_g2_i1.p1 TRINITY_DN17789_c0_g2~~TRINITY_DN17789_c0_g2_i1.p1  ORF type:complete len:484 (+),score=169.17 TRINITY_DN17789_c0_g2_i1:1182-2633(+)
MSAAQTDGVDEADAFFSVMMPSPSMTTPPREMTYESRASPGFGARYVPPVLPGMSQGFANETPLKTLNKKELLLAKKEKEAAENLLQAAKEQHALELKEMRDKVSKLLEDKRKVERKNSEKDKEVATCKAELQKLQEKSEKRDADLQKRTQELMKLRKSSSKQCDPLIAEVEKLKEENDKLMETASSSKGEMERALEVAAQRHSISEEAMLESQRSLRADTEMYRAREREALNELETCREIFRIKEDEVSLLKQKHVLEVDALQDKLTVVQQEYSDLKAAMAAYNAEARSLQEVVTELQATKDSLAAAESELTSARAHAKSAEERLEAVEEESKNFNNRLSALQIEHSTSEALLGAAKKVQEEYLHQMKSTAKMLKSSEYEREQLNAMLNNTHSTVKRQNEQLLTEIAESREKGILLGESVAKEKNLLIQIQTQADLIKELQLQLEAQPPPRAPIKARVDTGRTWDASLAEAVLRQSSELKKK